MRFIAVSLLGVLSATALFLIFNSGEASAFSPELRAVETEVVTIEEDEGYYDDAIISRVKPLDPSAYSVGKSSPPAHDTLPGFDPETARLLREMGQGPAQYLDSLRASGLGSGEPAGSPALAPTTITELPWVTDGLSENEKLTLELFGYLYEWNPAAAERIAVMPFLSTFGPADLEAVWSLARLALSDLEDETTALNDVLNNEHLADDGGIDDDEARIVAVLGGTHWFEPDLVPVLLDPSEIMLSEYGVQGRGGMILMTIIRLEPGSSGTDGLFGNAIRQVEGIMDLPLRTDYVGVLISDDALPGFAAGAHFGTHITISDDYDTDNRAEPPGEYSGLVIAHEVAHYYWFNDVELWIDEGAADFIAAVIENRRYGRPMDPDTPPCSYYDGIFHLELADPELSSYGGLCHYSLGVRFLHDLYAHMGEVEFLTAFRALYASASAEDAGGIPARQHFFPPFYPADLAGADRTIRKMILARHYGEVINGDERPVNPAIPALNGTVTDVVVARYSGTSFVGTYDGFFTLPATRLVHRHRLALIIEHAAPLPADTEVVFNVVERFEDGFVYDRDIVTETFEAGATQSVAILSAIGFTPNFSWPQGLYSVYVYHGGQKIAELYFDVAP